MGARLLLATWNVNSVRKRIDHIHNWINQHRPHALCLQETKVVDADFPLTLFDNLGYEVVIHGQKSYNGVAIASRAGLKDVTIGLTSFDDAQARVIEATVGAARIMCVYAPNGGGRQEKFDHKMTFYRHLRDRLAVLRKQHTVVAAGGDYNVAPRDCDVFDIKVWGHNSIAVSPLERAAYATVLATGYLDAHMELGAAEHAHTWWDYRANSYNTDRGLRIDHFLVSGGNCHSLRVDRSPREQPQPSDHAPVLLELDI